MLNMKESWHNITSNKINRELALKNYFIPIVPLVLGAFIGFIPILNWVGITGLALLASLYLYFVLSKNEIIKKEKKFKRLIYVFLLSVVIVTGSLMYDKIIPGKSGKCIDSYKKFHCQSIIYQNSIMQLKSIDNRILELQNKLKEHMEQQDRLIGIMDNNFKDIIKTQKELMKQQDKSIGVMNNNFKDVIKTQGVIKQELISIKNQSHNTNKTK